MAIEIKWERSGLQGFVSCDCEICNPPKTKEDKKTRGLFKEKKRCAAYKKASEEVDAEEEKRRNKERARQEALIAGNRSKAQEPAQAKVGETVPARRIRKWYGEHGIEVLTRIIRKDDADGNPVGEAQGPFFDDLSMTRHKGEKVYEIIAQPPTMEKFNELRDIHYTIGLEDLVSSSFGDIEGLGDEIRERYDNYPENLQGTDKYEELGTCADSLEEIREVDAPDTNSIKEKQFVYLPVMNCSSRSDRLYSATHALKAAIEFLQTAENFKPEEVDDAKFWGEEIEEAIANTDDICFPGMY